MNEANKTRADELLEALRYARKAYLNGETCSLTWLRERRMIVKEAEFRCPLRWWRLGLTDEILSRMNEA